MCTGNMYETLLEIINDSDSIIKILKRLNWNIEACLITLQKPRSRRLVKMILEATNNDSRCLSAINKIPNYLSLGDEEILKTIEEMGWNEQVACNIIKAIKKLEKIQPYDFRIRRKLRAKIWQLYKENAYLKKQTEELDKKNPPRNKKIPKTKAPFDTNKETLNGRCECDDPECGG